MALGANLSSGHGCHALNSEETLHGILLSNGAAPPAARKHACMHAPGQTSAFLVTSIRCANHRSAGQRRLARFGRPSSCANIESAEIRASFELQRDGLHGCKGRSRSWRGRSVPERRRAPVLRRTDSTDSTGAPPFGTGTGAPTCARKQSTRAPVARAAHKSVSFTHAAMLTSPPIRRRRCMPCAVRCTSSPL